MKEDEIKVNIKYEDDGKGKWQSVSARVEVDGDDYFFPAIAGFGETEKEAKKELKDKIIPLLTQVNKLFMDVDDSGQLENKTDCGLKCFELQDTEHALAVEKENNQKLEAEVARLKNIIEQPCTECCITDTLESSIDEMYYQLVNQNTEITNLKKQIEQLEAEISNRDECIDNLEHDLKDAGGELELWQRENAELKKTNTLLYEQEKEKWHDLRKDPNDLPKCTENEQVIFYVQEYYKNIEKYINHYCLGVYKKSFMDDDVKLFVEKSKGYECEHSTEEVLRWCELPKFEEG